ncbi:protein OS-9 homolog isoform X1 [Physcomitrium patens]|uniref:Protein OS-9 homolog n=1 Tax=Physcomitrium patens TaxID=3218 RepID=A0A7I4D6Z7_PHYPA|nr:protein OS-9 homolog isoform X1 [Physcomitrium patens]|eukprot:XP_024368657.1 protein OS-9 homolog isoform X1 [Physcomitrella patens]
MANLGFGLAFLFLISVWPILADSLRSSHSTDVDNSLQDPKYKIEFHPAESPIFPTSDQETIVMTDRDGKKFRCNLPVLESTKLLNKDVVEQNGTNTSLVTDKRSSRKTPEDLLDVLKDKCFRRYEGWWIYELCYKGHLRQFHLHDKKIVQEFVLGTYDAEATAALHENSPNISLQKDPRSQSAAQRYHAHVYTNGTVCDLTNQPRETEVRFVCSETGRALINSIKEAPTCKYTLVFDAPMLCKHPAFQEERQPWVVIDCNAIPSEEVLAKEGTTSAEPPMETVNQVETDAHRGSVAPALPESTDASPLTSLPEDVIPSSQFKKSEAETEVMEVPTESSEETKVAEEVAKPSDVNRKADKPAASSDGENEEQKLAALTKGEGNGEENAEELALPGHLREHPMA